ncbi:MAG: transposase [Planctomycetes bacterium]|nr:transposase [Planctomycetota bacterium]
MAARPLYSSVDQKPAYALRYTWSGWAVSGDLTQLAPDAWGALTIAWEKDGLRLLERAVKPRELQLTFSTTPDISPVFLATRAKGRLQHELRTTLKTPVEFSRKLAVRAVGNNRTEIVEDYIESQVPKEQFVDSRFADFLKQFTIRNPAVDLSVPAASGSGRYWYNLHLALVVDGRCRIVDEPGLIAIRDGCQRIAGKKGYEIALLSVMPDHLHLALRGNIEHSPSEIALAFQNNLAFQLNRGAVWMNGYYAGTFGEYDIQAIRLQRDRSSSQCRAAGDPS